MNLPEVSTFPRNPLETIFRPGSIPGTPQHADQQQEAASSHSAHPGARPAGHAHGPGRCARHRHPAEALFTQQGGAYGRCPNGTRALTVAELRGNAELQTYLRQITPGWSIYGLYDGTYLGQAYGGIIKDAPPGAGSFIAKLSASRPYTRPGNRLRITTTARSRPRACSPAPTAGCARYSSGTGNRSSEPAPARMKAGTETCTTRCGACCT